MSRTQGENRSRENQKCLKMVIREVERRNRGQTEQKGEKMREWSKIKNKKLKKTERESQSRH